MDKIEKEESEHFEMSWNDSDIERKIGLGILRPGKYTNVNIIVSLIVATLLFVVIYFSLDLLCKTDVFLIKLIKAKLDSGGGISYITLFVFCWGVAMLFIKNQKIKVQRLALKFAIIPDNESYFISHNSARSILKRIDDIVDSPKNFLLINRINLAISNLDNLGEVGDISNVLSAQERSDEENIDSSFVLINTLNWIIPILGFIGTVLGLGYSIGSFGESVKNSDSIETIKSSITNITSGLGLAFDTTLVALILVVVLQFLASMQMQKELSFLDECKVYCNDYIISKLRTKTDPSEK